MKGVLAHGDGIVAYLDMPDGHVIDQPGFERHAFTPYAVYNPAYGRRFQERTGSGRSAENWTDIPRREYEDAADVLPLDYLADRFRILLGHGESLAIVFKRKQQRVELLYRVAPGVEAGDSEYRAARMWRHASAGGNGGHRAFDVFRMDSLQWRTGSVDGWRDFPEYLQTRHLHLDRAAAWRMAWALVRAAYLDHSTCVDTLLEAAARESREKADGFAAHLDAAIADLKGWSLG